MLVNHREYFDRMISLIPQSYYKPESTLPEIDNDVQKTNGKAPSHKMKKNKKNNNNNNNKINSKSVNVKTDQDEKEEELRQLNPQQAMDVLRDKLHARIESVKATPNPYKNLQRKQQKKRKQRSEEKQKNAKKVKNNSDNVNEKQQQINNNNNDTDNNNNNNSKNNKDNSNKNIHSDNTPDLLFSKVEVDSIESKKSSHSKRGPTKKELLRRATKFQTKIERLKQVDEEKAEDLLKKKAAKDAVLRAQGIKIKDDPKLLKKALKRKEKAKAKSKAKWEERTESLKQQQMERQQQRNENLKNRMTKKKKKNALKSSLNSTANASNE